MKNIKTAGMLLACSLSFFACKKDDHHNMTPEGSIMIHSPETGSKYQTGDTVHIHATLRANMQLHGYNVYIFNSTGDTLFQKSEHAHENELEVHEKWVNTSAVANLRLLITTALDHHGNNLKKEQVFNIN